MFSDKCVKWLIPFVDYNYPSQRIRTLNVHAWLQANGVNSQLVTSNNTIELDNASVAVLSQASGAARIAQWCRDRGIATCLDICEDVAVLHGIGATADAQAVDMMVCCSTVLCEQHSPYGPVIRIPDAYEPVKLPVGYAKPKRDKVRVVWCGMQGNTRCLDLLYGIVDAAGVELMTISEATEVSHSGIHKVWNLDTWLVDIVDADIAICPQMHWAQPGKSNNKVTQAMSLGLPVLASPTVAYQEAIVHGVSGFICHGLEDWFNYLVLLRDNAELRKSLGRAAVKRASANYSIDAVGSCWIGLLSQLMHRKS